MIANDNDVDNPLTDLIPVVVANAAHGTATVNTDNTIKYVPVANYCGPDSFTYKNGDLQPLYSNTVTVTVTVTCINDLAVPLNNFYVLNEDSTLIVPAPGIFNNDIDVDNTSTFWTPQIVTQTTFGTVYVNKDGSFNYTGSANLIGWDFFEYRIFDSFGWSNNATVTLLVKQVNDAPTAANDVYYTNEDTPLTITAVNGVLSNDADVDTLRGYWVATVATTASSGSLTLNGDGSFTYTPVANFNGLVTFTYKVSDGTLQSSAASVYIYVLSVNDVPTGTADTYTTSEDTVLNVNKATGVLANDADIEGTITAQISTLPSKG